MSAPIDPKSKEWSDLGLLAESQGWTINDIRRRLMNPNTQRPVTPNSVQPPNGSEEDDDFGFKEMIKMQKAAMKMAQWQKMQKAYGLLGDEPKSEISDLKKQIEELKNGNSGGSSKLTIQDMMTNMMGMAMVKMMTQGTDGTKSNGMSMTDMIQLMGMLNKGQGGIQEALTFLQTLEAREQKGYEKGRQTEQQIMQQSSRQETFSDFVDDTTKEALKGAVADKIKSIFTTPEAAGVMTNGQMDIGKTINSVLGIVDKYIKKMPTPTQAPAQSARSEPLPAPPVEEESMPAIEEQPPPTEPYEVQTQ